VAAPQRRVHPAPAGTGSREIEAIALGEVRPVFSDVHGSAALGASAARVVAGELDPYTAATSWSPSL